MTVWSSGAVLHSKRVLLGANAGGRHGLQLMEQLEEAIEALFTGGFVAGDGVGGVFSGAYSDSCSRQEPPAAHAHTVPPCTCLRCSTEQRPPGRQRTCFVTPRALMVCETRMWRWTTFTPPRHAANAARRGLFLLRRVHRPNKSCSSVPQNTFGSAFSR